MKDHEPRTCAWCGQPFMSRKSGQLYCSVTCSGSARNKRRHSVRDSLESRTCAWCGQPFMPRQRNQSCCSERCGDQLYLSRHSRNRPPVERTCVFCGKSFESRRSSAKYCSMYCNHRYNRPHVPFIDKVCVFCGKTFKTHNSTARHCSKTCADRHRRWASLAEYEKAQAERKAAAFNKRRERDRNGLSLAEIQEVIDAQDGDKSLLWKRSQSWTKRQRKYARQRYEKNHGLFTSTFNP